MAFKTFQQISKGKWGNSDAQPSMESLRLGALLRIADSLESIERYMKSDNTRMIDLNKKINSTNRRIRELKAKLRR